MLIGMRAILTVLLATMIAAGRCEFASARPQAGSPLGRQDHPPLLRDNDVDPQQQDSSPRGESVTRWSREGKGESAIAANEVVAIQMLREFADALRAYYEKYSEYTSPYELSDLGYLPKHAGSSRPDEPYFFVFYSNSNQDFGIGAVPQHYGETARRSFYIGDDFVVHAVDAEGQVARADDPPLDAPGPPARRPKPPVPVRQPPATISEFEDEALNAFLNIHNCQQLSRYVDHRFATAAEIANKLSPPAERLDTSGYRITLSVSPDGKAFQAFGVPIEYGRTGRRSFYLDETFQLRGADRGGDPASRGDPAIRR